MIATPPQPSIVEPTEDVMGAATPVEDAPVVPELVLSGGMHMVRDSRGVRLATEPEESD